MSAATVRLAARQIPGRRTLKCAATALWVGNDGSFRPDQLITFAEASAILSRAYVLAPYADMNTKMAWYMPHAEALAARNVIPLTIKGFGHLVTDTETREMLDRLAEQITWKPSLTLEEVKRGKPFKAVVEVKN